MFEPVYATELLRIAQGDLKTARALEKVSDIRIEYRQPELDGRLHGCRHFACRLIVSTITDQFYRQ